MLSLENSIVIETAFYEGIARLVIATKYSAKFTLLSTTYRDYGITIAIRNPERSRDFLLKHLLLQKEKGGGEKKKDKKRKKILNRFGRGKDQSDEKEMIRIGQ